jgi:putative tricarboxylic transport membrane protein
MSEQAQAPAAAPGRDQHRVTYTAMIVPGVLTVCAFWAGWRSTGNVALTLLAAGSVLAVFTAIIAWRGHRILNPQDYYGGLALIGLALFAFWAASDLPGMRGFSFGPGTAPRLFAGVLLAMAIAVTAIGLFMQGSPLEHYAVRGPVLVTIAILTFAAMIRPIGLIFASFITFVIASAGSKEVRWVEALIAAVVLTTFCVCLFVYALNLPFQLWPRELYAWAIGTLMAGLAIAALVAFTVYRTRVS